MPSELDAGEGRPTAYRIRITGRLDSRWEEWFDGLTITVDGGDTLITGPVADQAALHGLLRRVRDLGLPLVSVTPVEGGTELSSPLTGHVDSAAIGQLPGRRRRAPRYHCS
jgi:hypothetical protein